MKGPLRIFLIAGFALWIATGCNTVPVDSALHNFYRGNLDAAETDLAHIPDGIDAVRLLMERGMIRHLNHDYIGSIDDLDRAIKLEKKLETHSISKAGASMLINDSVLAFRGQPFEQTYLHVFQARNYLSQGLWEDAGVEGRNIIYRQEHLNGFPDDAYSRYIAGLCLALSGDDLSAAFQYRIADSLLPSLTIDDTTGIILSDIQTNSSQRLRPWPTELICLIDIDGRSNIAAIDIYSKGVYLGSADLFTDTTRLAELSREQTASRKVTKSVARIAFKEAIAAAIAAYNEDLGDVTRFTLFAMEVPDQRSWQTLPNKLAIARVSCPPDLQEFDVFIRSDNETTPRRLSISGPFVRKNQSYFASCRNAPQRQIITTD
jgi:hypothetical protein